jgi:hypothetical protein
MHLSIHKELRHRGEPLVDYPVADLWKASGIAALPSSTLVFSVSVSS